MTGRRFFSLVPCLLALLAVAACDKATPVAPVGSLLTITANPAQIAPSGTSNITVVARREDGSPVNTGTEIILSASLGTIEASVRTDELGVARAVLRGDGRIGTSTVTALSGAAESVSVEVQVGSLAGSITLQATPTVVTETGATIQLLSLVRDENGQLLADAAVNFLTEIGTLASSGAAVFTDAAGAARDTLTVLPSDLDGVDADSFEARAQTAAADGLLIEAVFAVAIQRLAPVASFTTADAGVCLVAFTNTTTGKEPLEFEWDFDGDGDTDSTDRNPTFDYTGLIADTDGDGFVCPDDDADLDTDDSGVFSVSLTASNSLGEDIAVQTVTVEPD